MCKIFIKNKDNLWKGQKILRELLKSKKIRHL